LSRKTKYSTNNNQFHLSISFAALKMKVHNDINNLPVFQKAVVTIGTFDGVHLGHRQIINQLKKEAARIGGESVLVSFDPHPRKIVSNKPLQLLNTLAEKQALLEIQGIDHFVIVPFTKAFSEQSAREYVEDFLIRRFHPHTVIIGYDHKFGNNRSGDFSLLEKYATNHAFKLIEIPEHLIDEAGISSTKAREALLSGKLSSARRLLDYDYFFEAVVVEGNRLGRTIGYPTANLEPVDSDKIIPGNGVYAVEIEIFENPDGQPTQSQPSSHLLRGMMNIGFRPTIGGTKKVIEVHIFDFNRDIYGYTLRLFVKYWLRAEQKFNGLEALQAQLARDNADAIRLLAKRK
jgi:riboflavin kinase/FMN adenylyltransferase